MNLTDLRSLPSQIEPWLTDAKEGLVDSLLNLTWQRCSGTGEEGAIVYGRKPSLRFVSGFLLPRYEETGQSDETSDIHLSTHGIDCQIVAGTRVRVDIQVSFSVYVRALPEWDELVSPELDLFPNPPIRKDIEQAVRATMKERLASIKAAEAEKPADERRSHRELQQELYASLLAEHGVRFSAGGKVAAGDSNESAVDDVQASDVAPEDQSGTSSGLSVETGRFIFDRDDAAQEIDIPQKWIRVSVSVPALAIDLSDLTGGNGPANEPSLRVRAAVRDSVTAWLAQEDGARAAYREFKIRPSNVRSREDWEKFLASARARTASLADIAPALDGLQLNVGIETDLRDPSRQNLRVILENNSNQVSKRKRHRYEHAIHQVGMAVRFPKEAHRPLRLDRIEPSYRFREFMTYAAIGINCGVVEELDGTMIVLRTTWMPRYQQPRIEPQRLKGLPTDFATLGADHFDPRALTPIVSAYDDWIKKEERDTDPAAGAQDETDAERERAAFTRDIASYRRERARIALGIELLQQSFKYFGDDPARPEAMPYRAWLMLNRTFGDAGTLRSVTDWRLFQLAFILAHLPTIASRMPEYAREPWFDKDFDEETATLLYFPTGGGKSEAFFGLLIFNLFLDRLRGKHRGVTALVRYPLRLLTLQQAQRLLGILMRAELIRLAEGLKGAPFEIGFWVGSGNTPNKSDDIRLAPVPKLNDHRHSTDSSSSTDYLEVNTSFNKVPNCPICGASTGLRRVDVGTEDEIGIFCFSYGCRWNTETKRAPLPFLIIDRDIYRHAPAVLLGVIDKLALIGQHPSTINRVVGMFGLARWKEKTTGRLVMPPKRLLKEGPAAHDCEPIAPAYAGGSEEFWDPFPSLIIQDEAHLLEESLGTFAGLFETTLEQLLVRASEILGPRVARDSGGLPRLPKVIAATATVSVPQQQFGTLYQRRHMHFPYPGTSLYRSFYAAPAVPAITERRGIGGEGAKAPEIESPWMRTYASLMTNGHNHTVTTVAILAAYHLAITELWEDLLSEERRQLAVARVLSALTPGTPLSLFHQEAIQKCADFDTALVLTLVDLMRISLTYVTNKKGGDQVIDAFREEVAKIHRLHGRNPSELNTRLISGGVDVAQIQEIMRAAEGSAKPGDPFPELHTSLRNIVATSAISHGVDVDKFNAMFFAGMPNDIAEFIQASSRVGRSHVGFSLLVPTPQSRRDRYIVETHDVFHRFLERMIAPPAITRWAASAHNRILTSLFQAWLCGWVEQKLFAQRSDDDKESAPIFQDVSDVNRLLVGKAFPNAAEDFWEFAVRAIGVRGRGPSAIGAAPHFDFYDSRVRNLAKQLTDELRAQYATTRLSEYWPNAAVGAAPMTSLRDIDEAGKFIGARPFGSRRARGDDEKELLAKALRIVRRQSGRVSELDSEEGEG